MTLTASLLTALVSAWSSVGSVTPTPLLPDYGTAFREAARQKKPLVVFIGHGKAGHTALVSEGGLASKEVRILAESYVSCYIDADTESGRKLATTFEIPEGVVISDRTGGLQAVRHEGSVTKKELNDYLIRYAESTRVVTTTEYGGRARRPIINRIQTVTGFLSGST